MFVGVPRAYHFFIDLVVGLSMRDDLITQKLAVLFESLLGKARRRLADGLKRFIRWVINS